MTETTLLNATPILAELMFDLEQGLAPWSPRWITQTLCTMLVGTACGLLGAFVVLRRMALIGDALSHAVLPGVVLVFILTGSTEPIPLLVGAVIAGLIMSVLISFITSTSRTKEDSSIGIVFTAMFAVGIILYSSMRSATHFDMKCFLFGDPLAIGKADLWMMAVICPAVIGVIALMYHRLKLISFDPILAAAMGISVAFTHYMLMGLLSVTIVAGLKTTGVILVVALVITPASAAYQLTNRFSTMLLLSAGFGALAGGLGMSVAFVFASPTGPAIVIVAALLFVLAVLFSPSHGWVFERLRKRQLAHHVAQEDVLKAVYRLGEQQLDTPQPVGEETGLPPARIRKSIIRLTQEGLMLVTDGVVALTDAGNRHAKELVRAHRLWETYLVKEAGVDPAVVHDQAERLEHAHELAEELDEELGKPDTDPHGSQIPRG
ncbi:MAG: iron chelate uptake ABC transporter family permease subunit [Planctomycetota bacterium]